MTLLKLGSFTIPSLTFQTTSNVPGDIVYSKTRDPLLISGVHIRGHWNIEDTLATEKHMIVIGHFSLLEGKLGSVSFYLESDLSLPPSLLSTRPSFLSCVYCHLESVPPGGEERVTKGLSLILTFCGLSFSRL